MTYFGTYMTANTIDTVSAVRTGGDIKTVTAGTEKFVATSAYDSPPPPLPPACADPAPEQTCPSV